MSRQRAGMSRNGRNELLYYKAEALAQTRIGRNTNEIPVSAAPPCTIPEVRLFAVCQTVGSPPISSIIKGGRLLTVWASRPQPKPKLTRR